MSDVGDLIEALEADVARLKAELARVKEREAERVKRAFVEGCDFAWNHSHGGPWSLEGAMEIADRRLREGML